MKRVTVLLVLVFLAYQAYAQTFSASASARWQLPCTSSSAAYNPDQASQCVLNPTTQGATWLKSDVAITWGVGSVNGFSSTLVFSSFSNVNLPTTAPGVAIGKLTHLNYPINCYNNCSKYIPTNFVLDMLFNVSLAGGSVYATFNGIYNMVLDETPNVDGRVPFPNGPCNYNPNEASWVANVGGYTTQYPCCPYFTQVAAPGPLGSQFPLNGPCSDRLVFPNGVSSTTPFILGGTSYTVVISGFARSSTAFDSRVNFFTSQENQQQEAYIYAYVVRACNNVSGCDDGKGCTDDQCLASGVCSNQPKPTNTLCTDPTNVPYDAANTCLNYKCNVRGTCLGSATNNLLSCPNPAQPRPAGSTSDCTTSICNSGVCVWSQANQGSCTQATTSVTDGKCQKRNCVLGTCKVLNANEGLTCVANNVNQQTAITKYPDCNSAKCVSGICTFSRATGSCTSIGQSACNRRLCRSISLGGVTVGSCLGSFVSGSCKTGASLKLCNNRICTAKPGGSGSCSYQPSTGSCLASLTPLVGRQCKARLCNSGTCAYADFNNAGTCNDGVNQDCKRRICQSGTCVNTTATGSCRNSGFVGRQCKSRTCTSGTCAYVDFNAGGTCNDGVNQDCKRRICQSGTCVNTTATGSCRNSGFVARQCKSRTCTSGTCAYVDFNAGGTCNDGVNRDCKRRICQSGTCVNTTATGSCRNSGFVARQCKSRTCTSGTCAYVDFNSAGTCNDGVNQDCKRRICQSGTCVNVTTTGSCRNSGFVGRQCKSRTCTSGTCAYVDANPGGTCNDAGVNQDCRRRICASGTCATVNATGSCRNSGLVARNCRTRTCNSAGVCQYNNAFAAGSCTERTAVDCKRRTCSTAGTCVYNATSITQGSCRNSGLTATLCYQRRCSGTACVPVFQDGGSCAGSPGAPARQACRRVVCLSGVCSSLLDTTLTSSQGSCQWGLTAQECYRRACNSAGTCKYFTQDGGSCTGAGATPAISCNRRSCQSGACGYRPNSAQGSCTTQPGGAALAARSCVNRLCTSQGSCRYSNLLSNGGSCSSGAYGGAVSAKECNSRRCNIAGSCIYVANNAQGSCTSILPQACNKRKCSAGVCTGSWNGQTGSCGLPSTPRECYSRSCINKVGVGSCSFVVQNGGSCVGTWSSSLVAARGLCSARRCNAGTCRFNLVTGTCNNGKTTNDRICFTQRCRSVPVGGGGTCSTSVRLQSSCTGISSGPCFTPRCDANGFCSANSAGFPAGTPCTDTSKGTKTFCNPQQCDGLGSCNFRPDVQEGKSCLTPPDSAAALCITSQCTSGVCKDVSDLTKNGTFKCKANQPNEDSCSTYFCLFRSGSQFDHLGTCVRQVDTSTVGLSCIIPNNPDSTIDQRCYRMVCSSNGNCIKQPAATGTYCATPSNTIITNGYGCSQYECLSGTCNTAVAVPIQNGSDCAGSIPCDPSTPGCLSECQRFACFNGICKIDYFKENQNCTYIKYLTARDGSLVDVRDSEGGNPPNNECTTGKCYQGKCTAVTAQNGTSCGNRTKLGDLCYGDYCDSTGACVHTGRRNCAGTLPLPSVCWDVTCEASTGDCVLVANGVVDCSCINDCTACTAAFSQSNSTRGRTLGCWWCTGKDGKGPGCFNRRLPGSNKEIPAPKDNGPCYSNDSPCGGGGGLTGGQVAGIVVGILGLSSLAALALALGALLVRYFTAAGTPPANASLTDLAFDKNVKNNVFYEGANLEKFSAAYAEPRFITS